MVNVCNLCWYNLDDVYIFVVCYGCFGIMSICLFVFYMLIFVEKKIGFVGKFWRVLILFF